MSSPVTRPGTRFGIGSAVCGLFLALGHLVTGYVAFLAYMADPAGPWDGEAVSHSRFASLLALALTAVTAVLTWVFTKAEWSRKWWYALSAVLAVAAVLRLTVLAPGL
ncbi:hypothetical protein [Streptomyces sp. NPDC046759]|uniref:hypothetical protein n=1 Tax=Streptomyces sp. NPDC046759 TaxID=3155019 RepID=UPI0033FFCF2A